MRNFKNALLVFAAVTTAAPASADVIMIPTGSTAKPVPVAPPQDAKDTPEAIAKDAARDLKDSRFYNKPGATRAQYDADWQECRLIARGSRTPSGSVPYYYNPAVISPLAAGIGAGIGGAIAGAIIEGQQRRANRRNCLLIRGWRLVEVPEAEAKRVAAMSDEQRSRYFDSIVGAATVKGEVTERTAFSPMTNGLRLDAPVPGGALFFGKKVDTTAPLRLQPGEAAIVVAHRRPIAESNARYVGMELARYDVEARDLVYQPRDWKKKGDKTTYAVSAGSGNRKLPYEVQVLKVTPGDYVIRAAGVGPVAATTSFCFGAPAFRIAAGEVLYLGDFVPLAGAQVGGEKVNGLAYLAKLEDSRALLKTTQPALAAALKPAELRNRATFACSAVTMDRWDLPGVPELSATIASNAAPAASAASPQ